MTSEDRAPGLAPPATQCTHSRRPRSVGHRRLRAFAVRFALFMAVSVLPIPGLADGYTWAYEGVANCVLPSLDRVVGVAFRFALPERIRAQGSWIGLLRAEDPATMKTATTRVDVRFFSYRPMAMFLGLAFAYPFPSWRSRAKVLVGGLASMTIVTGLVTLLPFLARLGALGALGHGATLVSETLYGALTTPIMPFILPLAVGWLTLSVAGEPLPFSIEFERR